MVLWGCGRRYCGREIIGLWGVDNLFLWRGLSCGDCVGRGWVRRLGFLRRRRMTPRLVGEMRRFHDQCRITPRATNEVIGPSVPFCKGSVLRVTVTKLLGKRGLLLANPGTAKGGVLTRGLTCVFGHPTCGISFRMGAGDKSLVNASAFISGRIGLHGKAVCRYTRCNNFKVLSRVGVTGGSTISILRTALSCHHSVSIPNCSGVSLRPTTHFVKAVGCNCTKAGRLGRTLMSEFLIVSVPTRARRSLRFVFHQVFPGVGRGTEARFVKMFLSLRLGTAGDRVSAGPLSLQNLLTTVGVMRAKLSPEGTIAVKIIGGAFSVFRGRVMRSVIGAEVPTS